jgi:hypothetical protein
MSGDNDLGAELAKAIVGGAGNAVMPGVGALAAAGIEWVWPENLQKQVANELSAAIAAAQVAPPRSGLKGLVNGARAGRRQSKQAKGLTSEVALRDLIGAAEEDEGQPREAPEGQGDGDEAPDRNDAPDRERAVISLATVARAQLEAATTPLPTPGGWRERFATTLETAAVAGLDDPDTAARWTGMLTGDEAAPAPQPLAVKEWATLVTRIFAARITENGELRKYAGELQTLDKLAIQRAMLSRLDGQRQALNLLAAVLALAAIALGVDIAAFS